MLFFPRSILPFPHLEFQHPRFKLSAPELQPCPDPTFKVGGWPPLSQRRTSRSLGRPGTEEDIKKLRDARYLTAEILHRLPA